MTEIVRVLRLVEYVGQRADVERQVAGSIHGERRFRTNSGANMTIRATTLGLAPEVLDEFTVRAWEKCRAPVMADYNPPSLQGDERDPPSLR